MELTSGLEPPTYALPRRCATDCATSAILRKILYTILDKKSIPKQKIAKEEIKFWLVHNYLIIYSQKLLELYRKLYYTYFSL